MCLFEKVKFHLVFRKILVVLRSITNQSPSRKHRNINLSSWWTSSLPYSLQNYYNLSSLFHYQVSAFQLTAATKVFTKPFHPSLPLLEEMYHMHSLITSLSYCRMALWKLDPVFCNWNALWKFGGEWFY